MTAIQKFEKKNMAAFQSLADLAKQKKEIETQEEDVKQMLLEAMEKHGITSIDNDIVRINYIVGRESVSIDTKALLADDPQLYHEIESKYNKRKVTKPYIKVTAK